MISHNLTDVFAVADRIAVLRLGHLVSSGPVEDYDTQSTVELITTGTLNGIAPGSGTDAKGAGSDPEG